MSVTLYHHPFTRAASVVGMLEEAGCDYELRFVDVPAGEQKSEAIVALNPMGKLPILVDGAAVVTEVAAIGVYLADRYAPGRLAPALDDPRRATFLRWCFFGPSVLEPGAMAASSKWEYRPGSAGFGRFDDVLTTMEHAIGEGPWLLGDFFTMADLVLGGTLRFLLGFGMVDKRPAFTAWTERLAAREGVARGDAVNARIIEERGLSHG